FDHRAMGGKGVLQIVFCGVERKISNKQCIVTHVMYTVPRLSFPFPRLFPNVEFKIITELSSPEDLPCLEIDKLSIRPPYSRLFPANSNYYCSGSRFINYRWLVFLICIQTFHRIVTLSSRDRHTLFQYSFCLAL